MTRCGSAPRSARSAAVDLSPAAAHARALYLDLMKRCLLDQVYQHRELIPVSPSGGVKQAVTRRLADRGLLLVRERTFDPARRADGKGWPYHAHTMVGTKRLDNIEACVSQALADGVPGDLIETGVWRGGASIFMRAILEAYEVEDRTVWVADSFQGLPPPDPERYPADEGGNLHVYPELAVSLATVRTTSTATACSTSRCSSSQAGSRTRCRMHRSNDSRSCGSTVTSTSPPWTR